MKKQRGAASKRGAPEERSNLPSRQHSKNKATKASFTDHDRSSLEVLARRRRRHRHFGRGHRWGASPDHLAPERRTRGVRNVGRRAFRIDGTSNPSSRWASRLGQQLNAAGPQVSTVVGCRRWRDVKRRRAPSPGHRTPRHGRSHPRGRRAGVVGCLVANQQAASSIAVAIS